MTWPVLDGFPLNHLIVGWLAGNGIILVVGVLLFTVADRWARWRRRRALGRVARTAPDPIKNEVNGWPIVPDTFEMGSGIDLNIVRPSHTVPDERLDPSARAAVSEIRQKEQAS